MTAPIAAHESAARHLQALSPDRRADFALRLDRWWNDLDTAARELYPDPEAVVAGLVDLAAAAYAARPEDLHLLDRRRLLTPDWLQQPGMAGYACYTERFAGDLDGVADRIDHLVELGVTYLHLMPLALPRPGDNDGGYAVADYRQVRPDLGSVRDLRRLARTLRERGISLVLDLVLNHVAREHEWAVRARSGDPAYRDYFWVFDDRTRPDAYERTLPEVFPDFAPGSFTWDEELAGWVWTTFNAWQWDLNWSNPRVLSEFASLVLDMANLGVEVLRLDAIAFVWKRMGTDCQNQPEVHAVTQLLRTVARIAAPALALKAEAIVGPRDLVAYLGTGRRAGRVSDLAYHNSLMVQIWSMLAARNTVLARHALAALPPAPATGTWVTYVRCHDDIGWAIDDRDAAAVGLDGAAHRRFLSDWYAGLFPGSWADGLVFQHNPQTGDRRISGTAASLAGLAGPHADPEAGLARVVLAHAIAAGWGGVPVLWSGDELGLPNDPRWADEPGHADDNRWAGRPRLDPRAIARRHDPTSPSGRVFTALAHLLRTRAGLPQLHAAATVEVLTDTDDGILAVVRRHASGVMVGLYNVTDEPRPFPADLLSGVGLAEPWEALAAQPVVAGDDGMVRLPAFAAWWVVERP